MRFIFIVSIHNREKLIGQGEFECPHCRVGRGYQRKEVRPYLSFYFIPLFPVGKTEDVIQCQTCANLFEPAVIKRQEREKPKRDSLADLINGLQNRIAGGEPADYLIRDLTKAGVDLEVALQLVKPLIGSKPLSCATCGLNYAPNIDTCAECGQPLGADSK